MLEKIAAILLSLLGVALIYIIYLTLTGRSVSRQVVFLYIGLAVALPLFVSFNPPLPLTSSVQKLHDELNALPAGSKVLMAFDYDPPSAAELQPVAIAFFKYAFKRDLNIIIMGLWPTGHEQAALAIRDALTDSVLMAKGVTEGVDYVNLGFQSGNEFVIKNMGISFKSMFPQDRRRMPYDSIPLLQNVVNYDNIDYVFNLSSGKPGSVEWVQNAADRYGAKVAAANTAVQAPQMYPYLRTGRLRALIGGLSGAAIFEKAVGETGRATSLIRPQVFGHAAVMAFIVIGNIAYFSTRKKKKSS